MSIWFLPGRHGTPNGFKAQWFANRIGARPLYLDPEAPFDWLVEDLKRRIQEQGRPEALVGVSSGAAMIWQLFHDKAWDGPALLLCPALRRYNQRLTGPDVGHGVIFHGTRDSVVAIEDSESAVANVMDRFSLERCEDEEHALRGIFDSPRLDASLTKLGIRLLDAAK